MKNTLKFSIFFIVFLLAIIATVLKKIHNFGVSGIMIKREKIFFLKRGTKRLDLGNQLYCQGIINNPFILQWFLYLNPELTRFKAGTYLFKPNMTVLDILQLIKNGKEAQFPLRLIEGMRLSDYLKQLRNLPYIRHKLKDDRYETVISALKIERSECLEGWFWPDTWMYTANVTDISLLERFHAKMINVVKRIWKERDDNLPFTNYNQLLTMASIIEKETALNSERYYISSVFVNRLRAGMRLQADPTVIYGINYNNNKKISRDDLKKTTAYNTYLINGLPPGPIAVPGQASLNAAAHPAKTPYLYFVANGKGGHTFNVTLNDHNKSVRNYLMRLKKKSVQ